MTIRSIHQMLPNYWYGDAIGNAVTLTRAQLLQWGYKSEVYADIIHEKLSGRDFREYDSGDPSSMLIYHYSTGSRVNRFALEKGRNLILIYHNVTPASFYIDYNPEAADNCLRGRDFLRRFSGKVLRAVAVSAYNAKELEEAGVGPVSVATCMMDLNGRKPSGKKPFADGRPNVLFVGRISPNKNHEGLIKAFYFFRKYHSPQARLVLVGGFAPGDLYQKRMASMARGLGLGPDDVVFTGAVPDEDIAGYYESASLFLCLSLHEGLCIPLLEAMKFQKPVVYLNSTGVAGAMDGAGAMVEPGWGPHEAAELMAAILADPALARSIIAGQNRRLEHFSRERIVEGLRSVIEEASRGAV